LVFSDCFAATSAPVSVPSQLNKQELIPEQNHKWKGFSRYFWNSSRKISTHNSRGHHQQPQPKQAVTKGYGPFSFFAFSSPVKQEISATPSSYVD